MLVLVTLEDDHTIRELIDSIRALLSTISLIDDSVSRGAFQVSLIQVCHEGILFGQTGRLKGLRVAIFTSLIFS
jgi:hypothetical protein